MHVLARSRPTPGSGAHGKCSLHSGNHRFVWATKININRNVLVVALKIAV